MSTATATSAAPAKKRGSGLFQGLQKVGRSLQLPIAVLPAAGIMVRLGQDDIFGKDGLGWDKVATVFNAAGGAITGSLPILFCIGVAIASPRRRTAPPPSPRWSASSSTARCCRPSR